MFCDLYPRHVLRHKCIDGFNITLKIGQLLVHPCIPVCVGSLHGRERKVAGTEHPARIIAVGYLLL